MPDDRNGHDGWVPTSRADVGGDLLQRSLDQVERLLERLDYAPAPPAVAEWSRREDGELAEDAQRPAEAAAESDRLLSEAKRISEHLLAQSRDEADALARQLIAAATIAAEDIRGSAERDAEDIVSSARARMKRERAIIEGRAAERVDAAEHEAVEIRRHAWQIAHSAPNRRVNGNAASTLGMTPGTAEARERRERELLARAVGTMRDASRALDGLVALMASGSAELASAAARLESQLDSAPESRGDLRGDAAEALGFRQDKIMDGPTAASGSVATSFLGDRQ
ncbi:MAG: hypothetical protein QOH99_1011 [Frankiaceae bacterium]|nr:hypothetical protein [Frankiaceae bacterium]